MGNDGHAIARRQLGWRHFLDICRAKCQGIAKR